MVVSVLSLDSVHSNLGQLSSALFRLQQDRSAVLGKDWLIHHGVRTDKPQHFIRKILRAGEAATVYFTGTLLKR